MNSKKTRGFVTLATGNTHYYQLALNLLKSYRYRGGKYPFAILCDQKNEYTNAFDNIVLLENISGCLLDKFKVLVDSPFDETFFIEPDCIVYQNIDIFWEYFKNATDFSSFGWNDAPIDDFLNLLDIEKEWHINCAPLFCPAYLYVRKGAICEAMYRDCMTISNYLIENKTRHPKAFRQGMLYDDPVFFLAMKMNGCTCVVDPSIGKCIHYPSFKRRHGHYPEMHFGKGSLEDDTPNCTANLCHFSSKHTHLGKYKQQVVAMNCYMNGNRTIGRFLETSFVGMLFQFYWNGWYKVKRLLN